MPFPRMPPLMVRRALFAGIGLGTALVLLVLLVRVLHPGGWSVVKAGILLCFLGTLSWLGICAGNGVLGFALLMGCRRPARVVLPVAGDVDSTAIVTPTAIAITVRHEDMDRVLPPLRRLLGEIDAAGVGGLFGVFVLSDSSEPAHVDAEARAVAAWGSIEPRLVYRRRADNVGFKAGNVMDFLDHLAVGFQFAIMLDADSEMTAAAVLRLVRVLQAAPHMAIVQHLTVGLPAQGAFDRLFQFGMRAGMRVWAVGQAFWQADSGPYWGHNAVIRIDAFREHARLPLLPGGQRVLSHDQVEAARLRAAGWGVCVWAEEEGSLEANPPTLPDYLARDQRWLMGNLQYHHLLRQSGLLPMGRWQLVQAILLFAGAPMYAAMLFLTALNAAAGGSDAMPHGRLVAMTVAWALSLYAPKLLGYVEVLASPRQRARYGGGWRFLGGAAVEIVFALLLAAPMTWSAAVGVVRALAGRPAVWPAQNRTARRVGWGEAARLLWPHTLFGLVVFALLWSSSWVAVLWALPFAGGLVLAVPFCVATADPDVSRWMRRTGLAATPEELYPWSRPHSSGSDAASAYQRETSAVARTASQ